MAGASMKDIKLRIKSVESTMQITRAMQLVATSKIRRAKERMEESRPYVSISQEAIRALARRNDAKKNLFLQNDSCKRNSYVVIAGERGLAGGYNNNVFKALDNLENKEYCVLPLGRKAIEKYKRVGAEILSEDYPKIENLGVGECYKLTDILIEGYRAGRYNTIFLVHTTFHTMMKQEVVIDQLLPVMDERNTSPESDGTVYEIDIESTMERVIPDFIAGRLYCALCDSYVSELASRRAAMDSATKNASEMINDLRLKYNRARQGAITQEITEIIAGAE